MNTKNIDDATQYRVTLKEKIELFGQVFHPGAWLILRGDALKTVAGKVKDAQPV